MKKLTLILFLFAFATNTFGQFLPVSAQAKNILEGLNADFPQVQISLFNKGYDSGMELSKVPYQAIGLSKGFVTEKFSGCSLKLQNPVALTTSVAFGDVNPTLYGDKRDFFSNLSRDQKPTYLELLIPLHDLSHKKGKRPYLLSNNPKKADRYGKWAVELEAKRGVPVRLIATDEKGRIEYVDGDLLMFVLDNETSARKFDSDFREAIKLCSSFDPGPKQKLPPGIIVS